MKPILIIAAGILAAVALLPALPFLAMFAVAGGLFGLSHWFFGMESRMQASDHARRQDGIDKLMNECKPGPASKYYQGP